MENTWVDFKAVKASVSLQAVLERYQINWLRKKGSELRGRCPLHQGEGKDTFHANVSKGAFHCFSCHARGNVLDLVAALEKCSVRDAAAKLAEWFSVPLPERGTGGGSQAANLPVKHSDDKAQTQSGEAARENKPLAFELKGVDPAHSYLAARGISQATAREFGVGFFSGKGSMSGRVVIPIHNPQGELVAYAGRAIDGSEPKYKLPAGFHKSHELFNLHRASGASNKRRVVVVVEGFFDCLKVHQAGFAAVALMGSSLSARQAELLVKHFKAAWLMLDGDAAGRQGTAEMLSALAPRLWVRVALVPEGKQPDQLSEPDLQELLK